MQKHRIQAFGYRAGCADVVFEDGYRLRVFPVESDDQDDVVAAEAVRIRCCVLTQEGVLAVATAESFWSERVSQLEVAERLAAAVEAERQVYKAYRSGKIDERDWQAKFRMFWKVLIRCREVLGKLTVGSLPAIRSLEDADLPELS